MLHLKIGSHSRKRKNSKKAASEARLMAMPEVGAAVGLALHLYLQEIEDLEKTAHALHKMMPPSSPWSMKIYNITPPPVKTPRR